jgi:hypothetical protein
LGNTGEDACTSYALLVAYQSLVLHQWPNMTLLTVIGLSYSIIAPLISGFAFVAFFLFWFVYKVSLPPGRTCPFLGFTGPSL